MPPGEVSPATGGASLTVHGLLDAVGRYDDYNSDLPELSPEL